MFLYITVTMNVNSDAMADHTRLYADNYISLPKYNNLGRFRKSQSCAPKLMKHHFSLIFLMG